MLDAIRPGDAVMVKGSLGSKMGPIVKALESRFPRQGALAPQFKARLDRCSIG